MIIYGKGGSGGSSSGRRKGGLLSRAGKAVKNLFKRRKR